MDLTKIDPTPEELELWKLANIGDPEEFVPALRSREDMIEAAAIERAAATVDDFRRDPCSAGLGCDPMIDAILALSKPGARTLLDQALKEAYEKGKQDAKTPVL